MKHVSLIMPRGGHQAVARAGHAVRPQAAAAALPRRRYRCAGLRQDVGQRLHGGHPRLVAGCQLQRLPCLGARRAHRLRHLAELGVVRARLCAASQFLFGESQMSSLADYIQAALMLNYNKREVG